MDKSNTIAAVILGAAVGVALLKFFNMSKEEKSELITNIKSTTNNLLNNAEGTVEKVEHYMNQIKSKDKNELVDKMYILKKMFADLYSSERRYFI